MRSKLFHITIVNLIFFSRVFAQGSTLNLILNNSFEYANTNSPYLYSSGAEIRDTSFYLSPVSCWSLAGRYDYSLMYDTSQSNVYNSNWFDIPNTGLPYPENGIRSMWLESFFQLPPGNDSIHRVRLATLQTRLAEPLQAGVFYKLSGYVNSTPYVGDSIYQFHIQAPTPYGAVYSTNPVHVGFYFTTDRIYDSNNYTNITTSYYSNPFFQTIPTIIYTNSLYENDIVNPWRYFELFFMATGGEKYLSIAQSDTSIQHYPIIDSLLAIHEISGWEGGRYNSDIQLDNLTLIPLADTGKTVINLHISDPDSMLMQPQVVTCNGEAVALKTGAEFGSYIWSTGDTSAQINVTAAGVYKLTVSNGCGLYVDSVVVVSAPPVTAPLSLSASQSAICVGSESSTLTAVDSFPYRQWNTGDTTRSITVSQAGTYTCIVTNGCVSDTASIAVSAKPCCGNYNSAVSQAICSGNSYLFNGAQLTQSGVYKDTLQNAQGCDSIITLTLIVNPPLQSNLSQTICSGNSYLFNGAQVTQSGVYRDTLQNAQGCDSIITLMLTVNPPLQSNISQTICAGNSVSFNGVNYSASGTYSDTLQNAQGCDSIVSLTLTVLPIAQSNVAQTICEGDVFLFNGMPLSQSGNYIDTIQTSNACKVTTLALTVAPLPELVGAQNYFEIEAGDSVTLSACASGDFYEWLASTSSATGKSANNAVFSASPKVPLQTYTCIISNETGCADTCVYTVKVNGIYGNIYVPNAFSPNSDGTNDVFQIFGKYIRLQNLTVFNRWGEKVFESNSTNPIWDGTFKGVAQAAGVYTYELTYFSGIQNEAEHLKGSITLIR